MNLSRIVFGVLALWTNCLFAETADLVLTQGRIYTVNTDRPWVTAVAIRDGQFVYAGDDVGVQSYIGANTEKVNLEGRMAMPGIHDSHAHVLISGVQNLYECSLPFGVEMPAVIQALKNCERSLAPGEWLVGGLVAYTQYPDNKPHRSLFDEAFPDRPLFLNDDSLHQAMVNAKALEIVGINRNTPDPKGGRIIRDQDGEPTGMLIENATWLVKQHIPYSAETDRKAARWAVQQYNRVGITSVQEASANRRTLEALRSLENSHELTLDVAAHLVYGNQSFGWDSNKDLLSLIEQRENYRSEHIYPDFIKFWVDGEPLPPWFTSASLDPQSGKIETKDLFFQANELAELVTRFDAEGLTCKLHAAGQGGSRIAIDAIAAAHRKNPASTLRHELGHAQSIHPDDIVRMGKFKITGEMSPALWHVYKTLGDPPAPAWQFRSLLNENVLLTMGTDWVVTPTPDLFRGLQGMLQHGEESISLEEGIRTMTINSARSIGWDGRQGSIEAGKLANLIVLDRNLFEVTPDAIGETKVLLTLYHGQVVYIEENSPFSLLSAHNYFTSGMGEGR